MSVEFAVPADWWCRNVDACLRCARTGAGTSKLTVHCPANGWDALHSVPEGRSIDICPPPPARADDPGESRDPDV